MIASSAGGTVFGAAGIVEVRVDISHVAIAAEFLESVLAFFVLGAAGAFARFGVAEFFDDFADGFRVGFNRAGAGGASEAAIALSFGVCEVERDDRHVLALDIFPDVQLGPVEQRMNTNVRTLFVVGFKLVPQLRRLITKIIPPRETART